MYLVITLEGTSLWDADAPNRQNVKQKGGKKALNVLEQRDEKALTMSDGRSLKKYGAD